MTNYTDQQLKLALAKMLPEKLIYDTKLRWKAPLNVPDWAEMTEIPVLDTELLHLCWMVERSLDNSNYIQFHAYICNQANELRKNNTSGVLADTEITSFSWQQRTIALAATKGIEIV